MKDHTLDLLAIGEVMAEVRRKESGELAIGFAGDTFNTAVYCARELKKSGSVAYFTRIGTDPLSTDLIEMAKQETLDSSYFATDQEKLIGIYAVATDESGERSFSYWRENSAARQLFSNDDAVQALPAARITYLSGITLAIIEPSARRKLLHHLSAKSAAGETLVAFDSNYRPHLWESAATARQVISEAWEIADIALPSIDDEMALFGDATQDAVINRFRKCDWHACAIKRGANGPISPSLKTDVHPVFQPAAQVVDTTAAGDSFNAGYLAALLQGDDESSCLAKGHNLASTVIGISGAIMPRKKSILICKRLDFI